MRGSLTVAVIAIGLLLTGRGEAQNEPQLPEQYLSVKLGLGVGGSVHVASDAQTVPPSENGEPIVLTAVDGSSDLKTPAFAAEVNYIFSLHRYFGLGGLWGFHTWRSDAAETLREGTSLGVEVGAVIQPRLPVTENLELYVALPITLTLSILNEYRTWAQAPHVIPAMQGMPEMTQGDAEHVDPAFGYGLGALLGARYAISRNFGVLLEFGYRRFAFTHNVDFRVSETLDSMGSGTAIGLATVTQQFRVNAGVFF
jgi:hypothetical protein